MSLTKIAFVLLAAVFLMPTPPEPADPSNVQGQAAAPAPHYIDAASATYADVSQFCGRQPTVCVAAGHLLQKLEAKAKYSVRLLYEWANDTGTPTAGSQPRRYEAEADPLTTGSTATKVAGDEPSLGTLQIEDLIPEWRGPKSMRRG